MTKKFDITLSIIIVVDADDEAQALEKAVSELEDSNKLAPYITDTEIVEIDGDDN